MPCTDSAESVYVSNCARQKFKDWPLTVVLNLCIQVTQCLMVDICCIDSLVALYTTGKRNSRIIKQIKDTCIASVREFAVLDAAVWGCRTYRNRLINRKCRIVEGSGLT